MRAVYQRITTRLSELTFLGEPLKAYVGDPPANIPPPYAFTWGPPLIPESVDLASRSREMKEIVNVQVVANTAVNTLALAEIVAESLHGWTPDVDGWRIFPIRVKGATDVQTERTRVEDTANDSPRWVTIHLQIRGTTNVC